MIFSSWRWHGKAGREYPHYCVCNISLSTISSLSHWYTHLVPENQFLRKLEKSLNNNLSIYLAFFRKSVLSMGTILVLFSVLTQSLKWSLQAGPPWTHPRFTTKAQKPLGGEFSISPYSSRYKFELRLPFSRQRCSLATSSALYKSSSARLTVDRDNPSSVAIVRIPS